MERRVLLTTVHGSFGAHVLAARLADEGFDVELGGALDSPYAVTIGDLALVQVYVPPDQLEEASYVMLATEVEAALDDEPLHRHVTPAYRVAAGLLLATALLSLAHFLF